MAHADYEHCPGCDGKTIYMGDSECPEGVVTWHEECIAGEIAARVKRAQVAATGNQWDDDFATDDEVPCREDREDLARGPDGWVPACTWKGVNLSGMPRGGRTSYDPPRIAAVTEAYFRAGWRELTVWRGWDESGDPVARIATGADGKRTWWAESGETTP